MAADAGGDDTFFDTEDLKFLETVRSANEYTRAVGSDDVPSPRVASSLSRKRPVEATVMKHRGVSDISDIDGDSSDGLDADSFHAQRQAERKERKQGRVKRQRVDVEVEKKVTNASGGAASKTGVPSAPFEYKETIRMVREHDELDDDEERAGPAAADGEPELGECEEDRLLKPGKEAPFCFLCEYGSPDDEDAAASFNPVSTGQSINDIGTTEVETAYKAVARVSAANRKKIPRQKLVPMISFAYNRDARPLLTEHKTLVLGIPDPCPEWSDRSINDHLLGINGHRKSNSKRREGKLEMFDVALDRLRQQGIFHKYGKGVNDDKLKIALMVSKHQEQLMREQERAGKL